MITESCPYCGKKAYTASTMAHDKAEGGVLWNVFCTDFNTCFASRSKVNHGGYLKIEHAINAWNKRSMNNKIRQIENISKTIEDAPAVSMSDKVVKMQISAVVDSIVLILKEKG